MRTILSLLVAMLAACGGSTPAETTLPVDVTSVEVPSLDAYDYMPADSFGVLAVHVDRGRASPYFALLQETAEPILSQEPEKYEAVLGLINGIDRVYLSFGPHPRREGDLEPGVAVIEGNLTIAQILDALRVLEPGDQFEQRSVGAFNAASHRDVTIVDVGEGRMIFGPTERVEALAVSPPSSGFEEGPALSGLLADADPNAVFVVVGGEQMNSVRDLSREFGPAASSFRGGSFSVSAQDGIHLRARVDLDSDEAALQLAQMAADMKAQALREPALAMFGIAPIVEGIRLETRGPRFLGSLDISDAQVRQLVGTAMTLFGTITAQRGAPTPSPAPVP